MRAILDKQRTLNTCSVCRAPLESARMDAGPEILLEEWHCSAVAAAHPVVTLLRAPYNYYIPHSILEKYAMVAAEDLIEYE